MYWVVMYVGNGDTDRYVNFYPEDGYNEVVNSIDLLTTHSKFETYRDAVSTLRKYRIVDDVSIRNYAIRKVNNG